MGIRKSKFVKSGKAGLVTQTGIIFETIPSTENYSYLSKNEQTNKRNTWMKYWPGVNNLNTTPKIAAIPL